MAQMWLRACPKCRGDLYEDPALEGPFIGCVNCGTYLTPRQEAALRGQPWREQAEQLPLPKFRVNNKDVERHKREAYRLFAQGYGPVQVSEITGAQLRWVERWYARWRERRLVRA